MNTFDDIVDAVAQLLIKRLKGATPVKCRDLGMASPHLSHMVVLAGKDFIAVSGVNDAVVRAHSDFMGCEDWARADFGDYVLYSSEDPCVKFYIDHLGGKS